MPGEADYSPGTFWMCNSMPGLLIVGEAIDSPYPEDMDYIRSERQAGNIYGAWYSEGTFGGYELGTNPAFVCERISEEQFLRVIDELGAERYAEST